MEYRRLGNSGLKVSLLSMGSWATFGTKFSSAQAAQLLGAAYDAGINFFDNAEMYANGESERVMGEAIAQLGWPRYSYIVTTKFFMGIHDNINTKRTLNRKYLVDAMDASLERFNLDYVDIVYCHRPDPETPIEETVWTMSDFVASGKALYWGTSEFSADDIRGAFAAADRYNLRRPIVEQARYNILDRVRVEEEYTPIFDEFGIGLTAFAPLYGGLLSGKYLGGIPDGSRATFEGFRGFDVLRENIKHAEFSDKIAALVPIAERIGCTLTQLAIAWCTSNPRVSTVLMGASTMEQLTENLGAMDVVPLITPQLKAEITAAIA